MNKAILAKRIDKLNRNVRGLTAVLPSSGKSP
jgi:hypothetical protein